jgi:hypothetical protein
VAAFCGAEVAIGAGGAPSCTTAVWFWEGECEWPGFCPLGGCGDGLLPRKGKGCAAFASYTLAESWVRKLSASIKSCLVRSEGSVKDWVGPVLFAGAVTVVACPAKSTASPVVEGTNCRAERR